MGSNYIFAFFLRKLGQLPEFGDTYRQECVATNGKQITCGMNSEEKMRFNPISGQQCMISN